MGCQKRQVACRKRQLVCWRREQVSSATITRRSSQATRCSLRGARRICSEIPACRRREDVCWRQELMNKRWNANNYNEKYLIYTCIYENSKIFNVYFFMQTHISNPKNINKQTKTIYSEFRIIESTDASGACEHACSSGARLSAVCLSQSPLWHDSSSTPKAS